MTNIPASFMGTLIATILATGYVIFDEGKFHLWSPLARALIMGGASLVLVTYSISWFFLESFTEKTPKGNQPIRGEYWIRLTAQILLGLALAAIGISVGLYLWLFASFIAINFVATFIASRSARSVPIHDGVNLLLCCVYTFLALKLYSVASEFEQSYAAMVIDRASFEVRVNHLRGEIADPLMILSFVVGVILMNLVVLLIRSPGIRDSKLFTDESSVREQP